MEREKWISRLAGDHGERERERERECEGVCTVSCFHISDRLIHNHESLLVLSFSSRGMGGSNYNCPCICRGILVI